MSYLLYFLLGFVGMEVSAWAIHRYLMHGPLWSIHITHHRPSKGYFERNDWFSVFFGSVAVGLILVGVPTLSPSFWIGSGIAAYGLLYFVLHDVLIHQRVPGLTGRLDNRWLRGLKRAHQAHHRHRDRWPGEAFGLLFVPRRFFKD